MTPHSPSRIGILKRPIAGITADYYAYGTTRLKSRVGVLSFHSGFHIAIFYRLARFATKYLVPVSLVAAPPTYLQHVLYGCKLSPEAETGPVIRLPHSMDVVSGPDVVNDKDVTANQQVALRNHGKKDCKIQFASVMEDIVISGGGKFSGGIRLGRGSGIGINAVVLHDVLERAVAVGAPARVVLGEVR